MTDINEILEKAGRRCRENGTKLTPKRTLVLSGLLSSQKAMSAYELQDYCREHFDEALPPMSVYRILDFLESENLVHRLQTANKYAACTHISCDHAHEAPQFLICDSCSRVSEIAIEKSILDTLRQRVTDVGYTLQSKQLEMAARCSNCAK